MSAGDGIRHSEFNPSGTDPVHFLQIWIEPSKAGGEPRYADMATDALRKENGLVLFASGDGRDGSFAMRRDAEISLGTLISGKSLTIPSSRFTSARLHLHRGKPRNPRRNALLG